LKIEEAIEGLKNDIYGLKNFLTDTEKEIWQKAIETVLNELEKKDKVIDEMAKYINNEESGNIYELTCTRECKNEKCRMSVGDNDLQEIKCIKEYFYKRVSEEDDAVGR
jgi:hypothetical protein